MGTRAWKPKTIGRQALSAEAVAALELIRKRRERRDKGKAYARRIERRNDARKRQTGRRSEVSK